MENPNLFLVKSNSYDPWFNLALEEYLYDSIPEQSVILYLWQNQNTVVIGKSQNAWKECRVSELEADGGKLARRPSGGGAVFHDLGNMCYTFIASSGLYDQEKQLRVILGAVKEQGIEARFTGRNDITTEDGRKLSGNAFRFSTRKGLMHGTLLLDTDPAKMARYLQVSKAKMQAKGVDSVRARVVNLIELNPSISADQMAASLRKAFYGHYGPWETERVYSDAEIPAEIKPYYEKYASWAWRFGETPEFGMTFETRFSWGGFDVSIAAEKGVIRDIGIYTDAMDAELAEIVKDSLQGCKLSYDDICTNIKNAIALLAAGSGMLADPALVAEDLCGWFGEIL